MNTRELISQGIDRFIDSPPAALRWLTPSIKEHRYLPLYVGWIAVIGLRADGSFVRVNADGRDPSPPIDERDPFWTRMALFRFVRDQPQFAALVPVRPNNAVDCDQCGATGVLGTGAVVCSCGGSGWLVPGEFPGASPG